MYEVSVHANSLSDMMVKFLRHVPNTVGILNLGAPRVQLEAITITKLGITAERAMNLVDIRETVSSFVE